MEECDLLRRLLDSKIGHTDVLFLAHFGAPPISGLKQFDKTIKK
jgi:hypothetical protein